MSALVDVKQVFGGAASVTPRHADVGSGLRSRLMISVRLQPSVRRRLYLLPTRQDEDGGDTVGGDGLVVVVSWCRSRARSFRPWRRKPREETRGHNLGQAHSMGGSAMSFRSA